MFQMSINFNLQYFNFIIFFFYIVFTPTFYLLNKIRLPYLP